MHIIGKNRFVIEVALPAEFKNISVPLEGQFNDDGTQMFEIRPDPNVVTRYEYLWYCGMGLLPDSVGEDKATGKMKIPLPMHVWSPYFEQCIKYKDKDDADAVNKHVLGDEGGVVYEQNASHYLEGKQVVVPVTGHSRLNVSDTYKRT